MASIGGLDERYPLSGWLSWHLARTGRSGTPSVLFVQYRYWRSALGQRRNSRDYRSTLGVYYSNQQRKGNGFIGRAKRRSSACLEKNSDTYRGTRGIHLRVPRGF